MALTRPVHFLDDAVTDALTFFSVLTHLHHEESLIYLAEAARVGFTKAVIPAGAPPTPDGIVGLRAESLSEALHLTGLVGGFRDGFTNVRPLRPLGH